MVDCVLSVIVALRRAMKPDHFTVFVSGPNRVPRGQSYCHGGRCDARARRTSLRRRIRPREIQLHPTRPPQIGRLMMRAKTQHGIGLPSWGGAAPAPMPSNRLRLVRLRCTCRNRWRHRARVQSAWLFPRLRPRSFHEFAPNASSQIYPLNHCKSKDINRGVQREFDPPNRCRSGRCP